jgi:hypothetical protein
MFRTKLMKAIMLGLCLSAFSTGVALAETVDSSTYEIQIESVNSELLDLQSKIDKYIFDTNAKELEEKGFSATYTAPVDNYIEIGITPYSEKNADYLYDVFGKDQIKVIDGQAAVLYATSEVAEMATTGVAEVDEETLALQEEINKIVFENNLEKITEKGITVTHTNPIDGGIEVGINPFNQENADFIAELIGKDNVKVVEGIPAELYTSGMAEDTPVAAPDEAVVGDNITITDDMVKTTAVDATDDVMTVTSEEGTEEVQLVSTSTDVEKDNNTMPIVIISIAGVVVLLGGIVILNQKKKASR